jgi:AraC-like DNA-binding protein
MMQPKYTRIDGIEDFYQRRFNWMPEDLKKEIGHFNAFRIKDFLGPQRKPAPYMPKDYYKISLIIGRNRYHYADKTIEIEKAALLFSNPMIPYKWEPLDDDQQGCFCIFTEAFFSQFGNIREYPIFQPGASPVYLLDDGSLAEFRSLYEKLFEAIQSEYRYKYDLIRALTLEVMHKAMRMSPMERTLFKESNANTRIASLFTELLERQFPIESSGQTMKLRTPADFAAHLSVHINHLNRALKEVSAQTTSQLIADRIVRESTVLLRHTDWNIAEIGYCLGFEEPSHFISFFKRHTRQTPKTYRSSGIV